MSENLQINGRLLVLVPDNEMDEARYAKKARILAESHNLSIVFIGLNRSPDSESQIRRKLVTLAGIAGSEKIQADFLMINLEAWTEVLHKELGRLDYVLCPEEFNSGSRLYTNSADLKSMMNEKVYFVQDILISSDLERREEMSRAVLNWAGIIFLLVAGFMVEVGLDRQTTGFSRTIIQIVILTAEIVCLWFWNTLFIRREKKW